MQAKAEIAIERGRGYCCAIARRIGYRNDTGSWLYTGTGKRAIAVSQFEMTV